MFSSRFQAKTATVDVKINSVIAGAVSARSLVKGWFKAPYSLLKWYFFFPPIVVFIYYHYRT